MPLLTVLIVDHKPFAPDTHVSATLRNLNIHCDNVELIVNPDYQEMITIKTTVTFAALKHGFQADFTKCVCTPYDSSDGVKGIAIQVNGAKAVSTAKPVKPDHTREQDQKSDNGNCFIATAACGSPEAPTVLLLRDFREDVLRPSRAGRFFIRKYETLSPPLASVIARSSSLRLLTRKLLIAPLRFLAESILDNHHS